MHVSNLRHAWRFAGIMLLALALSLGRGSQVQAFPLSQGGSYTVTAGDTLGAIAVRFGTTVSAIATANNISNPNLIYPGQKLLISGASGGSAPAAPAPAPAAAPPASSQNGNYTVQAGDTLGAIAARFGVSYQAIAQASGIANPNIISVGQQLVIPGASAGATQAAPAAPAPAAPPAAPARNTGRKGFGYGIQADLITDGNHQRIFGAINDLGFNWVKQQVEWKRYEPSKGQYDWAPLDRIIDAAGAANINVLFSVVKAPAWARPAGDTDEGPPSNPADYADFVGKLAERYRGRLGAIEVWNEQNLYYEWGGRGHKLSASRYVQILAAAYNAIKAADPNIVVVSGAPTPTGVNDGDIAIDDLTYLQQMYNAGLARYSDAIGAHPSGYNNPPDADWSSYSRPGVSFGASGHPSWFFRGTMEGFRNIMVANGDGGKQVWPTELGWASVDGTGASPAKGYEYAQDNSEQNQAEFIVRAYQIAKSWGWVGPMFLWNLNFAPVAGAGDEKAAFGIVRADWGRRAAFNALAQMAK